MEKIKELENKIATMKEGLVDEESRKILTPIIAKAEKQLAELKAKQGEKKDTKKTVTGWRAEAKALGINSWGKKKVWVLEQIEKAKSGKGKETKKETKPEHKTISEEHDSIKLKGDIELKRKSDTRWEVLSKKMKNGKSLTTGNITKEDNGTYTVFIKHATSGFKTFKEAVEHLETELYQGVLKDMIDEKVEQAKKRKQSKENPLSVDKSLKDEVKTIKNKVEDKGITKKQADNSADELIKITKVIILNEI